MAGPENKSRDKNLLGGKPKAQHRRNKIWTSAVGSKQAQTPNQQTKSGLDRRKRKLLREQS
jgi:hypothetical protein